MTTFGKIKKWFKITRPNKKIMFWNMFLTFVCSGIMVVQAYPSAYVITSITSGDYNAAFMWLSINFALTALFYILWHIYYKLDYKQQKYVTENLSAQINEKVEKASSKTLNGHSIQKLILVLTANISTLSLYADKMCYMPSYILRAIISTIIVCTHNIYIGLIMFGLLILLYFWWIFLGNRSHKLTEKVNKQRDQLGEKLIDVISGRRISKTFVTEEERKKEFIDQAIKVGNTYHKRGTLSEVRNYWTYIACYGIITLLTIFMVNLTKSNIMSLTIYLVLAPYLIDIIDQAVAGYELFYELQAVDVCRARVETILNMPTEDFFNFSGSNVDDLVGNLILSNVSYVSDDAEIGSLRPTSLELEQNKITLIKGPRNCGKRAIFYMLRRGIKPTTGTITMDGINIYDFDKDVYVHNFAYVTNTPYFYNQSIMENLKYSGASKRQVIKVCKQIGIHSLIMKLPEDYETNPVRDSEYFSQYLLFMLGLARAICTESEWLAIYEFPVSMTKLQQKYLLETLEDIKKEHGIIVFSASDTVLPICDKLITVTSGSVRNLKKRGGQNE